MTKLRVSYNLYRKIADKIIEKIKIYNLQHPLRLGGFGKIVQIDETMLNFKCKSHRGRSSRNKTDAICIIEYDNKITKCFTKIIEDKSIATILPIINNVVIGGSTIFTNEHKSYQRLQNLGYEHGTVCHKYEFINKITGANTQAVESFNNYLKYYIKFKKGLETQRREEFLIEFTFEFNFKDQILPMLLSLIKIVD
ncbi:hypothetical protein H312_01340 [Anncaliia algerae PRA339]|uniref:ISXO2-like transposase domain-containing protein n=1 Tax=Anncaliia algerae PRA339 TaxID=1288291 RepID=A0A059F2C1_9MICR|nr:hypothetical protein H312_01340 [Anncaliia algerae PRA339]